MDALKQSWNANYQKALRSTLKPLFALLIAIVIGGFVLLSAGFNPLSAYSSMLNGSLGTKAALINSLTQMVPLLFTGLAYAFANQAGLINLGVEGQLLFGGLASAVVGSSDLGLPAYIHLPLAIIVGTLVGGLYGMLAGFLKIRFGANEFIVTLMLNYVAQLFCSYLVSGPLKAKDSMVSQSEAVLESAQLPELWRAGS